MSIVNNFSTWYLVKNGIKYKVGPEKNQIIYRANNWNEAILVFNISDSANPIRNQINAEDEVQVYIGDPSSSGVLMMDGFVNYKYPIRRKEATIELYIQVIDYIGYLAAKRIFEQRYWKLANTTAKQIFSDAASVIPGIITNIDSNLTELVKQDFAGTYAKDAFMTAGQVGFADYFGDENKILQAFSMGGRDLLNSSNATRYKLIDGIPPPNTPNILRVNSMFDYYFKHDVTQRFKTVIATSGVSYTYPNDINLFQESGENTTLRGITGRNLSTHYSTLGVQLSYDKMNFPNSSIPFDWNQQLQIGGINYPILTLYNTSPSDAIGILIGNMNNNGLFEHLGIPLDGTWQEINFFMSISGLSPAPTDCFIMLTDGTTGGTYLRYLQISPTQTLFLPGGLTFIRYLLPTSISSNGWTKSGNPVTIDQIGIFFDPGSGYSQGSYVQISQFYLYKKVRQQSSTLGGTPATQKIIMNRTMIDTTTLLALANIEYNRVSPIPYEVQATFYGNSDFKKPGYAVDVDFSDLLESDSKGTQLRIDQIIHSLGPKSRWNTQVILKPGFLSM